MAHLLEKEFAAIPTNLPSRDDFSEENLKRCRNTNFLPNPDTIVKLQTAVGGTTFVDANYARGADGQRGRYIIATTPRAAQDGMLDTRAQFLSMVFECNASAIVMMQASSDAYYPTRQQRVCTHGDITVAWDSETQRDKFLQTVLFLSRPNETPHRVVHFQYQDWLDDEVPLATAPFLALLHGVHECMRTVTRPVIVHCNTGAGASAVLVAVEHAIYQIETQTYVDLLHIVAQLRMSRGGAVSTIDEYDFLHKAACMYSLAVTQVAAPPAYQATPRFDDGPPSFSDNDDDANDAGHSRPAASAAKKAKALQQKKLSIYAPLAHADAIAALSTSKTPTKVDARLSVDVSELGPAPPAPVDDDDDDVLGPLGAPSTAPLARNRDSVDVTQLGPAPPPPSYDDDDDDVADLGAPPSVASPGVPAWKLAHLSGGEVADRRMACSRCPQPASSQCSSCSALFCSKCDFFVHSGKLSIHARSALRGTDAPPVCANCDTALATLHCKECQADFCSSCDGVLVHGSGVAQKHKRVPIEGAAQAISQANNSVLCEHCCVTNATIRCSQCSKTLCFSCDGILHREATDHRRVSLNANGSLRHFSNLSLGEVGSA